LGDNTKNKRNQYQENIGITFKKIFFFHEEDIRKSDS
jgi:hypothetical protein